MVATRSRGQAWFTSLNIDLFIYILNNSIFHPFVASIIPLCLRAGEVPYNSPAFINTVIYAALVCIVWLLAPVNEHLAHGRRRVVDNESEIAVVTGGSSGLGACIADIFALKGVPVAIIDIQAPKNDNKDYNFYHCDVSNANALAKTWARIVEDLGQPTILINNAGVVNPGQLTRLTPSRIEQTFQVNAVSHFSLASIFTQSLMQERRPGTLVTVSSVLGRLGAANLSAYTASKAALIAYHNSITAELKSYPEIKTILVTPGQLSTDMFASVRQSAVQRFFGPVVEVQQLAVKMVAMIAEGRAGLIAEPAYARWISVLDLLPAGLSKVFRDLAGVDAAMSSLSNPGGLQ